MASSSPTFDSLRQSPRPPPAQRHRSGLIAKLHRRHDARKHQEQHQPLLIDNHADEEQEVEVPERRQQRRFLQPLRDLSLKLQTTANCITSAFGHCLSAIKKGWNKSSSAARRNPKKILAVLLVILTATTAFLSIILAIQLHRQKENRFCTSAACVKAASNILANLEQKDLITWPSYESVAPKNSATDPCIDFHQFVCGGFDKDHQLEVGQSEISARTIIQRQVWSSLKRMLENNNVVGDEVDSELHRKVKDDYAACMNQPEIRRVGLEPLKTIVKDVKTLTLQNQTENTLRKAYSLQKSLIHNPPPRGWLTNVMVYLINLDVEALVSFVIKKSIAASVSHKLVISPGRNTGLPSTDYYRDNNIIGQYREVISESLTPFYRTVGNESVAWRRVDKIDVALLAGKVLEMEMLLVEITPVAWRGSLDVIKVSELEEMLPQFSILSMVQQLTNVKYDSDSITIVDVEYFRSLSKILENTTAETIQAFLVWKVIQRYAARVEHPSLQNYKDFSRRISGTESLDDEDRWHTCVNLAMADLGWILSRFYIVDKFTDTQRSFSQQIGEDIRLSSERKLSSTQILVNTDRQNVVNFIRSVQLDSGYPDVNPDITDVQALARYYSDISISNDSSFANGIQAAQSRARRKRSTLFVTSDVSEWSILPLDPDARYNRLAEKIEVPVTLLEEPFLYDSSVPPYITYGSLGSQIGHEFFKVVEEGFINNNSLTDESYGEFSKRKDCFAKQYSKLPINTSSNSFYINGSKITTQSIADAAAAKVAFNAWKHIEQRRSGLLLPGLEQFTKDQLFWISFGSSLCSKQTRESVIIKYASRAEAPNSIRILGITANSREFRQAFKCPIKESVCELW